MKLNVTPQDRLSLIMVQYERAIRDLREWELEHSTLIEEYNELKQRREDMERLLREEATARRHGVEGKLYTVTFVAEDKKKWYDVAAVRRLLPVELIETADLIKVTTTEEVDAKLFKRLVDEKIISADVAKEAYREEEKRKAYVRLEMKPRVPIDPTPTHPEMMATN